MWIQSVCLCVNYWHRGTLLYIHGQAHTMAIEIPSHYFHIVHVRYCQKINTPSRIGMSISVRATAIIIVRVGVPIDCSRCHTTVFGTMLPSRLVQSQISDCNQVKSSMIRFVRFLCASVSIEKCQDHVYVKGEYYSIVWKIKHYSIHEHKVNGNKVLKS